MASDAWLNCREPSSLACVSLVCLALLYVVKKQQRTRWRKSISLLRFRFSFFSLFRLPCCCFLSTNPRDGKLYNTQYLYYIENNKMRWREKKRERKSLLLSWSSSLRLRCTQSRSSRLHLKNIHTNEVDVYASHSRMDYAKLLLWIYWLAGWVYLYKFGW